MRINFDLIIEKASFFFFDTNDADLSFIFFFFLRFMDNMHGNLFPQSTFYTCSNGCGNETVKGRHLYATPLL